MKIGWSHISVFLTMLSMGLIGMCIYTIVSMKLEIRKIQSWQLIDHDRIEMLEARVDTWVYE